MKPIVAWARRLIPLFLLAISIAGCDTFEDVSTGVGRATKSLADKVSGGKATETDSNAAEGEADNQSASGTITRPESGSSGESGDEDGGGGESDDDNLDEGKSEDDTEAETETAESGDRSGDFNLIFEMSYQSCSSCGIWFDSAELVITHSKGRFSAQQSGSLLIKEAPYFQGRFNADISSIPQSAKIRSAILYMHLNHDEGISNDDHTSSISVYSDIGGSTRFVREITARDDIKGRGYSKANPIVPVDFTEYAKQL